MKDVWCFIISVGLATISFYVAKFYAPEYAEKISVGVFATILSISIIAEED